MHDQTILCIATRAWNSLWRDSQQIMSRMAMHNRVLYFEPGRNPDRPPVAEMWQKLPNFFSLHAEAVSESLIVLPTPSSLPIARGQLPRPVLRLTVPWTARLNAATLTRYIRRAIDTYRVENPILWLYDPAHIHLVGKFGERLVCYYNYDEHPDAVHNVRIKELMRQYDNRLSRRADVVFATSKAQCDRRRALNPHTYFVPNGVDFELFHRALDPDLPLPADIASLPRPIIGFAGWLAYHIDLDLLRLLAEAYPHCSIVLVGPDHLTDSVGRQRLQNLPNVFFLGHKERQELPNYLKAFDVALMPYALVGHLRSAYPLKLHEYLAAGQPIVATALPELQPFKHVVRTATTYDEFLSHIGEALRDNTAETIADRVAVARENTWDKRVADIYDVLQERLSTTSRGAGGQHEDYVHRLGSVRSTP